MAKPNDSIIDKEFKKLKSFFAVKFHETALFLMSFNLIVLLAIDIYLSYNGLTSDILSMILGTDDGRIFLLIIAIVVGMSLSIYHAFSSKKKSARTKGWMLYFAIMMNLLSAISAGLYQLKNGYDLFFIFPAWNILTAVSIYFLYKNDHSRISDSNAKIIEIVTGSILSITLILISTYYFYNHWSITFSITNAYATSLYKPLSSFLENQIKSFGKRNTSS
jgi:hypothetical protein